jgi:hypothetical protein
LMLSSSSSSTSPTSATLSPLIRYNPCAMTDEASSSSGGLMIRSCVCDRTCHPQSALYDSHGTLSQGQAAPGCDCGARAEPTKFVI